MNAPALTMLLTLASAFTLSFASASGVSKGGKFQVYLVDFDDVKGVSIQLKQKFMTKDSCNEFLLLGSIERVGDSSEYLASYGVANSEVGCQPLKKPRTLNLETKSTYIPAEDGSVSIVLFAPDEMEVVATPTP